MVDWQIDPRKVGFNVRISLCDIFHGLNISEEFPLIEYQSKFHITAHVKGFQSQIYFLILYSRYLFKCSEVQLFFLHYIANLVLFLRRFRPI